MSDVLERRYRRLLRLYPAAYRAGRADEMLGTLIDLARPGQRRPGTRETVALCRGALRARVGADRQRSKSAVWSGGLFLSVLLLLSYETVSRALEVYGDWRWIADRKANQYDFAHLFTPVLLGLVAIGLVIAAFVAVLLGKRVTGLALAVTAALTPAVDIVIWTRRGGAVSARNLLQIVSDEWLLITVIAVVAVSLRWRRPRLPQWWLLTVCFAICIVPMSVVALSSLDSASSGLLPLVVCAVAMLASLASAAVDARVPIGVGFTIVTVALGVLARRLSGGFSIDYWYVARLAALLGIIAAVLLAAGGLGARRQAAL